MNLRIPCQLYPLAAFSIVYMIFSGIIAFTTSNPEFAVYLLLLVILGIIILILHDRVNLPQSLLWCFSIWGLAHMMGGMLTIPETNDVLYNYWLIPDFLRYDQLIHAFGFGITTWACWLCLRAIQPKAHPTSGPLSLVLFAGLGLGALNETIEFSLTLLLPKTNVGDYNNIGWDLVFNLIGGLIAVITIRMTVPIHVAEAVEPENVSQVPRRGKERRGN